MSNETNRSSRLPADPDYWERLASGITADAAGVLEAYRRGAGSWFALLPRWSPALGVAAGIALAASFWWMPPPPRDVAPSSVVARALSPSDPLGERLVSDSVPPPVSQLLAASVSVGRR